MRELYIRTQDIAFMSIVGCGLSVVLHVVVGESDQAVPFKDVVKLVDAK